MDRRAALDPAARRVLAGGCALALALSIAAPAGAQSSVHPFIGAPEDQALIDQVLDGWFPASAPSNVVYVAPPSGSTAGSGTASDPYRDLIGVVRNATAGTAIYLEPGVYSMSQIRDAFGHESSVIRTDASGQKGNPIVLSTDPAKYDPASGQVAVLDFEFDNHHPGVRTCSIDLSEDFWLIEKLEIKNMDGRGIWLSGHSNVIRDNYMHHVNTPGTNNEGLILIAASGGPTNNVIAGNHFSHVGELDTSSGALLDAGGVNVGCIYTETRQSYDSNPPNVLPADSHVYIYNNYAHHCAYAYGTKNQAEGPYFFLSNVAHDVRIGVRNTFSKSLIRNNLFHPGAGDVAFSNGVSNGGSASSFWGELYNGHQAEIASNTIVGAENGIFYYSGWSVRSHDNLILDADEGLHIHRNTFDWYQGGAWPGIRGEWLLGDLGPAHPFYDLMPPHLQAMAGTFVKFSSKDNCYDAEPVIAPADFVQPEHDVTGMVPDEDHQLVAAADESALFVDTESYVRDFDHPAHANCGSRVGMGDHLPPTTPPPGSGGGAGASGASGSGGEGGAGAGAGAGATSGSAGTPSGADPKSSEESDGCGCRAAGSPANGLGAWALAALAWIAARSRQRKRGISGGLRPVVRGSGLSGKTRR